MSQPRHDGGTHAPRTLQVVVLGASGATGSHLVDQALARGHDVHAIVRDPVRWDREGGRRARGVTTHRGDVTDPASIAAAIPPGAAVVSALGARSRKDTGVLTAGAEAVLACQPARVVWLGAVGTGPSSTAVSGITHRLMRLGFGSEYLDKVTADGLVLAAGGTVVHAGPLNDKAAGRYEAVPVDRATRRLLPPFVPRAAAAQVILDCLDLPASRGHTVVCTRA